MGCALCHPELCAALSACGGGGDALVITSVTTPAHGSAVLAAGKVTYLLNGQYQQVLVTSTTTGLNIRQLTGSAQAGVATVASLGTVRYDGNVAPDEVNTDKGTSYVFTETSGLSAPTATELAASTFVGIPNPELNSSGQNQDTMLLNTSGTGKLKRSGKLVLTYASGVKQTIVRLSAAADGEERWMVRYSQPLGGVQTDVALKDAMVVKLSAGAAFSADAAANRWKSYVNAGVVSDNSFFIVLNSGNTGRGETEYLDGRISAAAPFGWQVSEGVLTMPTYWVINGNSATCPSGMQCGLSRERSWTKLAVSGTKVFVMEHLWINGGLDQWRINRYEATAPATAQATASGYQLFALPDTGK